MKVRPVLVSIAVGAGVLALPLAMLPSASAGASVASATTATSSPSVHTFGHMRPHPHIHIPRTHLPQPTPVSNGPDNLKVVQSTNWSGYADTAAKGVKMTDVSAEFNVPSVNCANSNPDPTYGAWTSEWVGIDGYSSASVEQDGVSAYCATTTSTPVYYAWYEMYPQAPVDMGTVNAGDAIDAQVYRYRHSNTYVMELNDVTQSEGFSIAEACPSGATCPATSAEDIMEAPAELLSTGTVEILPLADYGLATFGSSQVVANWSGQGSFGASSKKFTLTRINMVTSSGAPASTAYQMYGGRFFSTYWSNS